MRTVLSLSEGFERNQGPARPMSGANSQTSSGRGAPLSPKKVISRVAQLYVVEQEARDAPPDVRLALRKAHAAPGFDDLEVWLALQRTTVSGKSSLATIIRYGPIRVGSLRLYSHAGRLRLR